MSRSEEIKEVVARLRRDRLVLLDLIADSGWQDTGYPSLSSYLRDLLRITLSAAKQLAAQADAVCPSVTLTGEPLPPKLPQVRAALVDGTLDDHHVTTVIATLDKVPEWVEPAERDQVEKILVEACRVHDPSVVRRIGSHIIDVLDQDGPEPCDASSDPVNDLAFRITRAGRVVGRFDLNTETGAALQAALSPLTKPVADDTRTLSERQGDALAELIDTALTSGELPTEGGERPHLTVTVSLDSPPHRHRGRHWRAHRRWHRRSQPHRHWRWPRHLYRHPHGHRQRNLFG